MKKEILELQNLHKEIILQVLSPYALQIDLLEKEAWNHNWLEILLAMDVVL